MTTVAAPRPGSPRGYREALTALGTRQKPGSGVPAYTRYVNRWLGRRAAAAAYAAGVSPNAVTLLSGAVSAVGIALIAVAPVTPGTAAGATGLLLLGYALDSADGQLARLTGTGSRAGEWLDHVVDAARLPAFHLAVAVSLYRSTDLLWPSTVALVFALVVSVWFFAQILAGQLADGRPATVLPEPAWRSAAKLPVDLGVLYLVVLLLPATTLFTWVYVVLAAVSAAMAAVSLVRKFLALEAISHAELELGA